MTESDRNGNLNAKSLKHLNEIYRKSLIRLNRCSIPLNSIWNNAHFSFTFRVMLLIFPAEPVCVVHSKVFSRFHFERFRDDFKKRNKTAPDYKTLSEVMY